MTPAGRPLRFLAAVAVGWIGVRAVILWPTPASIPSVAMAQHPQAMRGHLTPLWSARVAPPVAISPYYPVSVRPPLPTLRGHRIASNQVATAVASTSPPVPKRDPARILPALLGAIRIGEPEALPGAEISLPYPPGTRPAQLAPHPAGASRWSADAWLFVRRGNAASLSRLAGNAQLGGSQAGARIGYAIDAARRLIGYARVTTALTQPEHDAAIGLDWRPTRLPVRLIAEQRIPLGAGTGGPTLGAVGGFGPVDLPRHFRLEAYGQGGIILRDGGVGFADGALRLNRTIAHHGPVDIALGAGAWGAAQPGAARVDVGPALTLAIPVDRHPLRLSLDWRQRVAGQALPASGPALTIGADF